MAANKKKTTARHAEAMPVKSFLDMIAPSVVKFNPDHFICGNTFRCVWALREYPTQTDEQALLRHLGEKDGITLRIYTRQLTPAEEDRILHNAASKNRMNKSNPNDLRQTIIAETNLQDMISIQCSECGSFYRRRIVSGTVKWVCSLHKDDSTACSSNYYSEERIYDGFISMVNKLRFSEDNILGQVISRLEMTLAAMKRNNTAARDLSKSIAELNAKLLMLEQLRSKGYLAPEVYQAQANEINAELAKLKDVRQEKFNSKAATMLEEVRKLKMLIFEQEEPLEAFDEKLFLEIVKSIQINKEDEMSVELLGGLRFRERI